MISLQTPRHRAATRRRLPRVAVGAIVAAVAAVLLLGTNGSLALWRTSGTVAGGNVGSGSLALAPNPGCTAWKFTRTGGPSAYNGTAYPGAATDGTTTKLVQPNDTLTTTCTYTLTAAGTHLRGAFVLAQPGGAPAGATATASYTVGGASQSTFTAGDNGKAVVATVTLDISSSVTGLQGSSFTLTGASITAKQVHA